MNTKWPEKRAKYVHTPSLREDRIISVWLGLLSQTINRRWLKPEDVFHFTWHKIQSQGHSKFGCTAEQCYRGPRCFLFLYSAILSILAISPITVARWMLEFPDVICRQMCPCPAQMRWSFLLCICLLQRKISHRCFQLTSTQVTFARIGSQAHALTDKKPAATGTEIPEEAMVWKKRKIHHRKKER